MRKLLIVVSVAITLAVLIGAAGCGTPAQTAGLSPGGSSDLSAEAILAEAMTASQNMTSARGAFDVTISFDADPSALSEEEMAFLGQPMKVSGTVAYGNDPQAAEFTVTADLAQQTMDLGMKLVGDKAWFRFQDQWYEAPPEMQGLLGDSSSQQVKATNVQQMLADLGIDPVSWMKDLRLAGEETLEGTAVYHLAATPDLTKMMTDVMALLQSGELTKLIDPTGSMGSLGGPMSSPTSLPAEELQQVQEQLEQLFADFTIDLWIAQDTFFARKLAAAARLVPPAGEDADGLNAITLDAVVSLEDINEPVTVEPPASARPWTEFEKAMEENPEMFMGPFSGAAFGAGSTATQGEIYQ